MSTIFEQIIGGEIPADFLYRDEEIVAFRDINPAAPVHVLIVPVNPIPTVDDVRTPRLGGRHRFRHVDPQGPREEIFEFLIRPGPRGRRAAGPGFLVPAAHSEPPWPPAPSLPAPSACFSLFLAR